MTAKKQPAAKPEPARPAPERFTPELLAEAAKLRDSGLTWNKIGEQLDVRSTGLLSKRVREAAAPSAKPARKAARRSTTPTPKPRPRKTAKAASAEPTTTAGEEG